MIRPTTSAAILAPALAGLIGLAPSSLTAEEATNPTALYLDRARNNRADT